MKNGFINQLSIFVIVLLATGACGQAAYANAVGNNKLGSFKGLKTDISIGVIDGTELLINIAVPKTKSKIPRATMVMIHAGGAGATKKDKFNNRLKKFAERGIVAASVMYRFPPQHKFPTPIVDVKAAIRFLKANAKTLNIDPNRIVVAGNSKGGYLATMIGVTGNDKRFDKHGLYPEFDSTVRAVISFSGSLANFTHDKYQRFSFIDRFINTKSVDRHTALTLMSPVTYLDKHDPPFFIAHGNQDDVVPVDMSRDFVAELKAINHEVNYIEIDGGTHNLRASRPDQASAAYQASTAFFLLQTQ